MTRCLRLTRNSNQELANRYVTYAVKTLINDCCSMRLNPNQNIIHFAIKDDILMHNLFTLQPTFSHCLAMLALYMFKCQVIMFYLCYFKKKSTSYMSRDQLSPLTHPSGTAAKDKM